MELMSFRRLPAKLSVMWTYIIVMALYHRTGHTQGTFVFGLFFVKNHRVCLFVVFVLVVVAVVVGGGDGDDGGGGVCVRARACVRVCV